ncbi:two-component sensor histidine kinase [Spirilliplanes yamanashiensis]|uniref:histidine kinase n=2 Tax=Spirilliplanes yamanashiensis TaxID=42233 RepID=A0A8J4DJB2_9ACTN|nr:two-component system OmpR family sensor kinase [Spirilliplanes yamanashiensis]GIJ04002.1 two-component sensor histidine kinase [Spirilliplanes yamanashiensis]
MIGLLTVLGLVVGATTEVVLRDALHHQVDNELTEASRRAQYTFGYDPGPPGNRQGRPAGSPRPGGGGGPAPGQPEDTVMVLLGARSDGGVVKEQDATFTREFETLPADALAVLAAVPRDGASHNRHLGDEFGDYRLTATAMSDGSVVVTGLPLAEANRTMLLVAGVVGGVLLLMLVAAGAAGAVIIRRTLRPLDRVAATASRVSELTLTRGVPELTDRVPEADTDPRTEVGQVGAALNRMLDHVGNALEARHASEMQVRQFVADASHELRTPLAAIRGYAELSRRSRTPVPDEVAHVLRRVESEAQRMTTLVEDLLLLARLDAGRPLAHEPVDLTALVVDAVSDAHAAGPRHDWRLDLPAEPVTVTGDAARLHQVLANLLANARTHTPEGTTVTVGVARDDGHAVLRVTDAGPGIPPDLLPHVFERFARGDSSRSRAAGSTGLGLAIVAAVVAAHRGEVTVDSGPGRTAFAVRLPAPAPSA